MAAPICWRQEILTIEEDVAADSPSIYQSTPYSKDSLSHQNLAFSGLKANSIVVTP
jgi:hypothetical protein